MSNTRRTNGDGPMRQERYASSEAYETGLKANLVAKRCTVLESAEDRELVWFLQLLSFEPGGLKRLAAELCSRFPERIATPSMQKFGNKPGQIYNASQVRCVREEMGSAHDQFLLKGESSLWETLNERSLYEAVAADEVIAADAKPASYPASDFIAHCYSAAAEHLERRIIDLCLDPKTTFADGSPWYFPSLVSTLRETMASWIAERASAVVTTIGEKVNDALDFAREMRRMVLLVGDPRIGKSHAAKTWCDLHPGSARYVQTPSTNDELGFFREIAKAIGVSSGLGWKAVQLRERIEDVLQTGQLTIVFDDAQYLFPTNDCRNTQPGRLNWIMTALINKGVPVGFVTWEQFFRTQHAVEKATSWNSAQFTGRIGKFVELPNSIPRKELIAVARQLVPEADAESIETLVIYASKSNKYIEGIKAVRDCARYSLRNTNRTTIELRDVMLAIDEAVMPSDRAFASAVNAGIPVKPSRRRAVRVSAQPLQGDFSSDEIPVQPGEGRREQFEAMPRQSFVPEFENAQ